MSTDKFKITEANIFKLLENFKKSSNLLASQENEFGDINFLPVEDTGKVMLKAHKPLMPSVREALFGQIEPMIEFEKKGRETKIKSIDNSEETVIFGLPNCDIAGILYTDNFFAQREFEDYYYKNARDKLTLISMSCLTPPSESCFCATMKTGPFAEKGFDIQFTDMEDGNFFVNIGSEKGRVIVTKNKALFDVTDADYEKKWEEKKLKASGLPVAENLDKDKALGKMAGNPVDDKLLSEITNRCISCGACNYVCPTCTCFNVTDIQKEGKGIRKRIIDSCMMSGYFRMAGGHNPMEKKEQRTRNRYYCKLLWDKMKFGDTGCVGCGRCLDACPVNIDIKEIIQSLS